MLTLNKWDLNSDNHMLPSIIGCTCNLIAILVLNRVKTVVNVQLYH
jgi:hypothetical protein